MNNVLKFQVKTKERSYEGLKKLIEVIREIEKEHNAHCTLLEVEFDENSIIR